jgi:hypothetical protein
MSKEVIKKVNIREFIDKEMNMLGYVDEPTTGPNMDTKVGNATSDKVARTGHQNFDYDFLGRFGFTMWESEMPNPLIKELAEMIYNKSDSKNDEFSSLNEDNIHKKASVAIVNEILGVVRKHMKESFTKRSENKEETLSEAELKSVIEDIVLKKKKDEFPKKSSDNDVLSKDLKSKIDKLSKTDRELLVKYIEESK